MLHLDESARTSACYSSDRVVVVVGDLRWLVNGAARQATCSSVFSSLTGSWSAFNIAPCECDGKEGMKKSIVAAFAGCLGSRDGCSSS